MTASFKEGTHVEATGPTTYSALLHPDWCIGTVPHGGYVTSIFLSVIQLHFSSVRAEYRQPHTIAVQLSFLRRTSLGPATFTVTESKLGQRTSTIHVVLTQGTDDQPLVVGYFTQSNIITETGASVTLPSTLHPAPAPLSSTQALHDGTDPNWRLHETKFSKFRKAGQHLLTYLPRNAQAGSIDQWLTLANGENFTQESLGFVVDSFPQLLETAQSSDELSKELSRVAKEGLRSEQSDVRSINSGVATTRSQWANFWYPTVVLNVDIKKVLPAEGCKWLFSRVTTKQIRNGRMDIEILVLDQTQDIVAISNHVALIVPADRNVLRRGENKSNSENKL